MQSKNDFFLLFSFFLYEIYTRMRANVLPTMPVIIMVMGKPTDPDRPHEFSVTLHSRSDLETLAPGISPIVLLNPRRWSEASIVIFSERYCQLGVENPCVRILPVLALQFAPNESTA